MYGLPQNLNLQEQTMPDGTSPARRGPNQHLGAWQLPPAPERFYLAANKRKVDKGPRDGFGPALRDGPESWMAFHGAAPASGQLQTVKRRACVCAVCA